MTLSEMKQVLAREGIRLTKSLGQNFMHDGNQLRRLVRAAGLRPRDQVLEIGPGLGPLTELLLAEGCAVLAVEKDRRLFEFLQTRFSGAAELTLVHGDALDLLKHQRELSQSQLAHQALETGRAALSQRAVPWSTSGAVEDRCLTRSLPRDSTCGTALPSPHTTQEFDWSAWKLVANLPYSVASPILVELAQGATCPARIVVTLQEEVARRLMAAPGTADYGVLTLLVQIRYQPIETFRIPATCFYPAPETGSACVTLARRAAPLLPIGLIPAFARLVKRGFSQRRKMMSKLLKADWPPEVLDAAFHQLKLSPQARAESVSLEQFAALTRAVADTR